MLNELFATLILHRLSATLLPTDGAALEAAASGEIYAEKRMGEQGTLFNSYLSFVEKNAPVKVDRDSLGVVTTAKSAIIVDAKTGVLLYGEKPYDVRAIGSVTKLMAVMVFLDTAPDLTKTVTLDPKTDLVTGGRQYVAFYEPIKLYDVLGAVLVGSDNSATQSLVRFSGLTEEEFIRKMNEKALELGLAKTFFTDPTGIEATNVSTALDLSRLLSKVAEYDQMTEFMQASSFTFTQGDSTVQVEATNDALRAYQGNTLYKITAGKTGYLPESGYVLISTVQHEGHAVHVVVMGASSRENRSVELRALAEWAFRVYKWPS